jgi:hypothetical protein
MTRRRGRPPARMFVPVNVSFPSREERQALCIGESDWAEFEVAYGHALETQYREKLYNIWFDFLHSHIRGLNARFLVTDGKAAFDQIEKPLQRLRKLLDKSRPLVAGYVARKVHSQLMKVAENRLGLEDMRTMEGELMTINVLRLIEWAVQSAKGRFLRRIASDHMDQSWLEMVKKLQACLADARLPASNGRYGPFVRLLSAMSAKAPSAVQIPRTAGAIAEALKQRRRRVGPAPGPIGPEKRMN